RVLQDIGIWNVQCAGSNLCLYSITKGDSSETFRFDVKDGKSSAPPQIDPACSNWSLSADGSQRAIAPCAPGDVIILRSTLTNERRKLAAKGWTDLSGCSIVWSADGKALFLSKTTVKGDRVLLNVKLDGRVSVLLRTSDLEILGAIPSPDGRAIAIAGA